MRRQTLASLRGSGLQLETARTVPRELPGNETPPRLTPCSRNLRFAPARRAGAVRRRARGRAERGGTRRQPGSGSAVRPGGRALPGRRRCSRSAPLSAPLGAALRGAPVCPPYCRPRRSRCALFLHLLPAEPSGGGDVGAAGREAGRGGRALPGGDGNERRPRPSAPAPCATRHGEEARRPLSEAHTQTETCPLPAAICGEKPPGSRLRRDMEAVKAFNSEVCNPLLPLGVGERAGPRGRRLPCPLPLCAPRRGEATGMGGPGAGECSRGLPPCQAGAGRCRRPWEMGGGRG